MRRSIVSIVILYGIAAAAALLIGFNCAPAARASRVDGAFYFK